MAYKRKVKQAAKRRQSVRFNLEFDRTKWLRNSEEIKEYREEHEPENGLCPILEIKPKTFVLDHDHAFFNVRSVISQQANSWEGAVNKYFSKYCSSYTSLSISDCLRNLADYYEQDYFGNPLHYKGIEDLKNHLLRCKKETITQKLKDDFGVQISEESALQRDLVEAYLQHYIKMKEGE